MSSINLTDGEVEKLSKDEGERAVWTEGDVALMRKGRSSQSKHDLLQVLEKAGIFEGRIVKAEGQLKPVGSRWRLFTLQFAGSANKSFNSVYQCNSMLAE
jgi:hypothetical protein